MRWHFEAPAVFLCPPAFAPGPAVTGGGVYLADYLGTVYALDATDGRDRWRIATEARQSIEPVLVARRRTSTSAAASALYTLDAVTGTPKWRFAAGGEVVGAPVVADGRVHFGSADHCLYTLDAAGGQLRWKLATGGEITGSPVAQGGVVYACSKDRCVYALDAVKGTGTGNRRAARRGRPDCGGRRARVPSGVRGRNPAPGRRHGLGRASARQGPHPAPGYGAVSWCLGCGVRTCVRVDLRLRPRTRLHRRVPVPASGGHGVRIRPLPAPRTAGS